MDIKFVPREKVELLNLLGESLYLQNKEIEAPDWLLKSIAHKEFNDARESLYLIAEKLIAHIKHGVVSNVVGEADTILYDVVVNKKNGGTHYISVKSSANAPTFETIKNNSRVKLMSIIKFLKEFNQNIDMFTFSQAHINFKDNMILIAFTPEISLRTLKDRIDASYPELSLGIDYLGRLQSRQITYLFGNFIESYIIKLPDVSKEVRNYQKKIIDLVNGLIDVNALKKILETIYKIQSIK